VRTPPVEEAERDRIIEAFIAVVAERGYKAAPLEAVLARAGVVEEAFRRHFDDEEACFRAAWELINERYVARAMAGYEGAVGWREQIRAVAQAILDYLTEFPDHARILFVEGPTPGDPAQAFFDAKVELFIELIDSGRAEATEPDLLTRATAEGIAGAVSERIALCLKRGEDEELAGMLPELMFLVVRPYLGTEVAAEELHRAAE
jgi:AcrR family transcriptional regulator